MSKIIRNEKPSMCSVCTNVCCKQKPGGYTPEQVPPSEQEQLLENGLVEWDYWLKPVVELDEDGDEWTNWITWWYLRPAIKPDSSCIHHTDKGCSLSWEQRPYECQALVPRNSANEKCKSLLANPKKSIAMAWFLAGRQE